MTFDRAQWAMEKYDEIVAQYPNGIAIPEARELYALEYEAAILRGEIPPMTAEEMAEARSNVCDRN